MSRHDIPRSKSHSPAPETAPPREHVGPMLFRIVGEHLHRAVVGDRTYWCVRETIKTEAGLSVRWSALHGKHLLKGDCRTLNEAKKHCRIAAGEVDTDQLRGDLVARGTTEAAAGPGPIVSTPEPCEDSP